MRFLLIALLLFASILTSCGPVQTLECNDEIDNDNDGLIDFQDRYFIWDILHLFGPISLKDPDCLDINATEQLSCLDSDNGKDINIKATVTNSRLENFTDSCTDEKTLNEGFCDENLDNGISKEQFSCEFGCLDGRCRAKEVKKDCPERLLTPIDVGFPWPENIEAIFEHVYKENRFLVWIGEPELGKGHCSCNATCNLEDMFCEFQLNNSECSPTCSDLLATQPLADILDNRLSFGISLESLCINCSILDEEKCNQLKSCMPIYKTIYVVSTGLIRVNESLNETKMFDLCTDKDDLLDWHNKDGINWMSAVRDQAMCGSCWAFAAIAAAEGKFNIMNNIPSLGTNLSEQDLVSCSGAGSCAGGWPSRSLDYISKNGILKEECLPYQARNIPCEPVCNDRVRFEQSQNVTKDDIQAMQEHIKTKGPITVALVWNLWWDEDGIGRCRNTSRSSAHAIAVVGYNDIERYWIIKNSWGIGWEDNGYSKIGFGECDIENYDVPTGIQ